MFSLLNRHKKVPHPTTPDIYGYQKGYVFTNGANIFGFDFNMTKPLFSVIGPATNIQCPLMITQPPQVYVTQAVPIVGLGGLQAGQLVTQPLVNPDFSPLE